MGVEVKHNRPIERKSERERDCEIAPISILFVYMCWLLLMKNVLFLNAHTIKN